MSRVSLCVTLVSVSIAIACGGLTGPESVAGTYALVTIGGEPLPHRMTSGGFNPGFPGGSELPDTNDDYVEITSSSIQLNADTTFSWTLAGNVSQGGDVTPDNFAATGTFVVVDTTVELYLTGLPLVDPNTPITCSIVGDTLTMGEGEGGEMEWVFVKV